MYEVFEQLLQKYKITPYKVAKEAGVTQTALSNWKSGRSTPSAKTYQKIADYFGVSVDYLMTGNTEDNNDHYYANEETREIAQEIFENPDLRSLFHAARDLTPERLKAHIDFMQSLKQQEEKHNDEGC